MRTLILGAGVLLVAGCGKRQTVVHDQPSLPTRERYEIVWVDPQLVVTDTLFTLIRSDRIDSIYMDRPDPFASLTPSVRFHISEEECNLAVNLLDARYQAVLPLLVKRVRTGWYKLTFNADRLFAEGNHSVTYFLQADFCDRSVRQAFVAR